ncbi:MAG: MBL fold metallo-hydrolase [Candidatus Ranarchaeia archaeon]
MKNKKFVSLRPNLCLIAPTNNLVYDANIYVIGSQSKYWLVDCGLLKNYDLNKDILHENGYELTSLEGVLLTHCHADHAGAACLFSQNRHAQIHASPATADALEKGDTKRTLSYLFDEEATPVQVKPLPLGSSILLGTIRLNVIHTPGHTIGSVCFYEENTNSLISGDTVFANGMIGRTNWPTGNTNALFESLKKINEFDIDCLMPGHGPVVKEKAAIHIRKALSYFYDGG